MAYIVENPNIHQDFMINELKRNGFAITVEENKPTLYCNDCDFEKAQAIAKQYNMEFSKKKIKNYFVFY